ncbi:MAG TPA: tetratricopeptide repeat protein [Spirochaetota bacterium]
MYYRYKSKKSSGRPVKILVLICFLAAFVFLVYHFRGYLQFWRYSYNRIVEQIDHAGSVSDPKGRTAALNKVLAITDEYIADNPNSCEPYYLQARVYFNRGVALGGGDLISFIIDNKRDVLPSAARSDFEKTIQQINKGLCFDSHSVPDDEVLLLLAKSYFYINYYGSQTIQELLSSVRNPRLLKNGDDRKFFGLMKIVGGNGEEGVQFLVEAGDIHRDDTGKLFLASAYTLAKQYTNAIIEYKSILENVHDPVVLDKAKLGLGRVYFTQSLFREAMAQFSDVLKDDPSSNDVKIWIARCALSTGDKAAAKKICSEILAVDKENPGALVLLKDLQ